MKPHSILNSELADPALSFVDLHSFTRNFWAFLSLSRLKLIGRIFHDGLWRSVDGRIVCQRCPTFVNKVRRKALANSIPFSSLNCNTRDILEATKTRITF